MSNVLCKIILLLQTNQCTYRKKSDGLVAHPIDYFSEEPVQTIVLGLSELKELEPRM